jgi:hypothetical protein
VQGLPRPALHNAQCTSRYGSPTQRRVQTRPGLRTKLCTMDGWTHDLIWKTWPDGFFTCTFLIVIGLDQTSNKCVRPCNPDYHQCGSRFLFVKPFVNGIISLTDLDIPPSFRLTISTKKKRRRRERIVYASFCFACQLTLTQGLYRQFSIFCLLRRNKVNFFKIQGSLVSSR